MISTNLNRPIITYENIALFQSESPAYDSESNKGDNITRIQLVQNIDFSFQIPREDIKSLGSKSFVDRVVKTAPDINLNINIFEDFGFLFYSMFSGSGLRDNINLDTNFYAVIGDKRGDDIFNEINLSGKDVLSFGNCFFKDLSMSQSVKGLMTSQYSFVASNVQAQQLTKAYQEENIFTGQCPAINLTGDQSQNLGFEIENSGALNRSTSIIPAYSTNVTISGNNSVGNFLIQSDPVQSFNLDLSIDRKDIYTIGKKYPLIRKAVFPNKSTFNFSNKISNFEVSGYRSNLKDFLNTDESYTVKINGTNFIEESFELEIKNATFDSQNISSSIDSELTSQLSFSFDITDFSYSIATFNNMLLLQDSANILKNDNGYILLEF